MKALIVEDEFHAARRLKSLLTEIRPGINLLEVIDSVEDAVAWLKSNPSPDLLFLDIQLADGLSFDIFTKVELQSPVIFTTAFDDYALQAFKINSIDYLLKPIDKKDLENALLKYDNIKGPQNQYDLKAIEGLIRTLTKPEFIERFVIKAGNHLHLIRVKDTAYFFSENSLSFLMTRTAKRHTLDYTLDQLEDMLDPGQFFRINRKTIIHIDCIQKVGLYFNNRLKLETEPATAEDIIVSRERVKEFRKWLGA